LERFNKKLRRDPDLNRDVISDPATWYFVSLASFASSFASSFAEAFPKSFF